MSGEWRVLVIVASAALLTIRLQTADGQPATATTGSDAGSGVGSGAGSSQGSSVAPAGEPDDCAIEGSGTGSGTGSIHAAGGSGSGSSKKIDVPMVEFSVPDAPAFNFLGVTPSQITQPQSARELAAAAATVIGTDGKIHQGAAIEWTPYKTLATYLGAHAPTLENYGELYFVHNFQISIGTSQALGSGAMGSGATETDGAFGFRTVVWNQDDPALVATLRDAALEQIRLEERITSLSHEGPPTDEGVATSACKIIKAARKSTDPRMVAAVVAFDAQTKVLKQKQADIKKRWNQTLVAVGFALGEMFPTSQWNSHAFRGWAAWLTASYGFHTFPGQLILTGRYHSDAKGDTPGDTSLVGGRFVVGNSTAAGFAEFAWNWLNPSSDPTKKDNWGQASTGVEVAVGDKTWLVLAFGGVFDKSDQQSDFFAISNLKWSIGNQNLPVGPLAK